MEQVKWTITNKFLVLESTVGNVENIDKLLRGKIRLALLLGIKPFKTNVLVRLKKEITKERYG